MKYSSNTYTFLYVQQMNMDKQISKIWLARYGKENATTNNNRDKSQKNHDKNVLGSIYEYDSDDEDHEINEENALEILIEILGDDE